MQLLATLLDHSNIYKGIVDPICNIKLSALLSPAMSIITQYHTLLIDTLLLIVFPKIKGGYIVQCYMLINIYIPRIQYHLMQLITTVAILTGK